MSVKIVFAAPVLSLSLLVTGCITVGTSSPGKTRDALALGNVEDKALVYFMAPQLGGNIVNIAVDGRTAGKVKDRTFISCYLAPGMHHITTRGQFPVRSKWDVQMIFDPHKTYYIITTYAKARLSDPPSSRRILTQYYSLSKNSHCE